MTTPSLFCVRSAATLAALSVVLTACGPATFSVTFGQRDNRLTETAVLTSDDHAGSAKVALIEVRGLIADAATPGLISSGENPVDRLVASLDKAAEDRSVRAVVLRIDSPGGSVTASDVMYREIARFRERTGKPVIASLSTVAASGGYYIALAADEIVTEPTCITGSIGVIFPTFNFSEAMNRWGIASRAVVSRPNKDLASPFEPMEEEHYAILQRLVDEDYARFRGLVVERRPGLSESNLEQATDGRIFSGQQAIDLGLADSAGGIREAFDRALAAAGVEGGRLVRYHPRGVTPRTAYARAEAPENSPQAAGPTALEIRLPGSTEWPPAAGAYYLWMP
ncbi:MAG: signal peptide peptidase SppA [Phycisphaerales bacterium]|nr:signal peptide peptidase SppA [Phycisphaerales bacterium]